MTTTTMLHFAKIRTKPSPLLADEHLVYEAQIERVQILRVCLDPGGAKGDNTLHSLQLARASDFKVVPMDAAKEDEHRVLTITAVNSKGHDFPTSISLDHVHTLAALSKGTSHAAIGLDIPVETLTGPHGFVFFCREHTLTVAVSITVGPLRKLRQDGLDDRKMEKEKEQSKDESGCGSPFRKKKSGLDFRGIFRRDEEKPGGGG